MVEKLDKDDRVMELYLDIIKDLDVSNAIERLSPRGECFGKRENAKLD